MKASQRAEMRRLRHEVAPACRNEPTTECGSRTPTRGDVGASAPHPPSS